MVLTTSMTGRVRGTIEIERTCFVMALIAKSGSASLVGQHAVQKIESNGLEVDLSRGAAV